MNLLIPVECPHPVQRTGHEWLEMVSALNEVDGSILDCKKDIEEFNNSIQKLHWDIINRIQDNFSGLSDEISNLVGLINEIDAMKKLTNAKIKAMNAENDLNDYRNSLKIRLLYKSHQYLM